MKGIAIIAAAGKGTRAGEDKIWLKIGSETMLEKACAPFFDALTVDEVCLVKYVRFLRHQSIPPN